MGIKLEINSDQRQILKWKHPDFGLIEATIWDGKLTDFRACENGSNPTICNINMEFLKVLAESIISLEDFLTDKKLSIETEQVKAQTIQVKN